MKREVSYQVVWWLEFFKQIYKGIKELYKGPHIVKAIVFPVVMYRELDLKKTERQRIDAFELWS